MVIDVPIPLFFVSTINSYYIFRIGIVGGYIKKKQQLGDRKVLSN
jgi:hypothetical protein